VSGSTYKRCPHGQDCPDLEKRRHGSWFFQARIETTAGRRLLRRGGYGLERDAKAVLDAIDALLGLVADDEAGKAARRQIGDMIAGATRRGGTLPDRATVAARLGLGRAPGSAGLTVGEWLDQWLASRRKIRASVYRSYEMHIRVWLKPHLGHLPLERFDASHIDELLFATIDRFNAEITAQHAAGRAWIHCEGDVRTSPRLVSASTKERIFATLRAAMNNAVKKRKIAYSPCTGVELEAPERRERGRWTPAEAARFIAFTADGPMGLMFRIAVLRGARRGELCGFRWTGTDLERGILTVERSILQLGGKRTESTPKTAAGERKVFLGAATAALLREHRKEQLRKRMTAGAAWQDDDLVFCRDDGTAWNPDYVTRRFKKLAADAGVPVITLHEGGRHTGNSLMRDAGVDQDLRMREVGHADRSVNDRYTHILEEAHLEAAEQVEALVAAAGSAS
jgi:integrase